MITIAFMVFGACFLSISFIVFLACILLGSRKDISNEYEETIKMKRFLRKYQKHVDGVKDESGVA